MNAITIQSLRAERSVGLKKMRTDKGITRKQLSDYSNLHLCTIYRIESGETSYNIDSEIIYIESIKNYDTTGG